MTITAAQLEEWKIHAAGLSSYTAHTVIPVLAAEVERLRAIVRGFLNCPEIADCAPDDKDPETDALERRARAALPEEPAD